MPYKDRKLNGTFLDLFKVFCQRVSKTQATPDLINYVAGELVHVNFCRDIIGSDKNYQDRFEAFCRKNKFDADKIRRRLGMVATVLGVGKRIDYYKVLGVAYDADEQTIRRAYRKKAPHFHPDKVSGDNLNNDKFIELHEAYVHLSDPVLRDSYDQLMHSGNDWLEGQRTKDYEILPEDPQASRFFSYLCILLVVMACIIVVLNHYHKRSSSLVSKRSDRSLLEESNAKFQAELEGTVEAQSGQRRELPQTDRAPEPDNLRSPLSGQQLSSSDKSVALSGDKEVRLFYHSRRTKRFWTAYDARHDSFEEAMQYLAIQYQRSPNWVATHMGSTNDLAAIHRNLSEHISIEKEIADKEAQKALLARLAKAQKKDSDRVGASAREDAITEARTEVASPSPRQETSPSEKVAVLVKAPESKAPAKVETVVAAKTPNQNKKIVPDAPQVLNKQRILAFLENYTSAYEQKDLDKFETYFTEDAVEMGKEFKTLLSTYQKTFDSVDALRYRINLKTFSVDKLTKTIHVNGAFLAEYRLPEKDWIFRSGSIRMELLDAAEGLLVRQLEYEMDQ